MCLPCLRTPVYDVPGLYIVRYAGYPGLRGLALGYTLLPAYAGFHQLNLGDSG
jgi:hypothetical protein